MANLVTLVSSSSAETQSLGHLIAGWLPPWSIVGLDGPLGSGKTCFVQGIALGLGVPSYVQVTSPAYTLVQEYPINHRTLIHIDFYRLNSLTSNDYCLFEELFANPDHIIMVEWASKFMSKFTSECLNVSISPELDSSQRSILITSDSPAYEDLLEKLSHHANAHP